MPAASISANRIVVTSSRRREISLIISGLTYCGTLNSGRLKCSSSAILPFTWLLPGRRSKAPSDEAYGNNPALRGLASSSSDRLRARGRQDHDVPTAPGVRACQDAGHHSGRFWELVVQAPPDAIGDRRLRAPRWPGGRGRF